MAKSRRILSVLLAVLMVLTLVPAGMFSMASAVSEDEISTASVGLDQSFLERPSVNISSTAVIRTAASADSQAAGTTIVKATDSGLPELSGEKASAFYAGETPKNPMVVFTSDKALKTAPTITCSNAVLTLQLRIAASMPTVSIPIHGSYPVQMSQHLSLTLRSAIHMNIPTQTARRSQRHIPLMQRAPLKT